MEKYCILLLKNAQINTVLDYNKLYFSIYMFLDEDYEYDVDFGEVDDQVTSFIGYTQVSDKRRSVQCTYQYSFDVSKEFRKIY